MVQRILLAAILFLVSTISLGPAHARVIQAESLVVTLEPSSGETVSGLVILSDAGDDKTNVQVQIVGAEPGTATMIHAGTCTSFDPIPVGLLGDAGASGTIQSTITVSFATLTDGNHVVAIHAGIASLDTALACGEIPSLSEPPDPDESTNTPTPFAPPEPPDPDSPTSTPEPFAPPDPDQPTSTSSAFEPPDPDEPTSTPADVDPVNGRTYTSPTYGYSLSWDDTWSVEMVGTIERADLIILSNFSSRLELVGDEQFDGDLTECLTQTLQRLRDETGVEDIQPLADDSGQPIAGVDSASQWGAYSYLSTHDNSETGRRFAYFQCFQLTDAAVLALKQSSFVDQYPEDASAREAVMATLRIPGQSPRPTAEPSAPPTTAPTEVPTAVPTLEPTPTPDSCAGVDAWIGATQVRINRLFELILDVSRADIFTIEEVLSGAGDEIEIMARDQEQEPTPALAADLQEQFVKLLWDEVDLAERQLDLYKTDPGNKSRQERISAEATANIATLQEIDGKVSELRVKC